MKLYPLQATDPGSPPSVGPEFRGVAIHWAASGRAQSRAGRRFAPLVPERAWRVRIIPFRALTQDHSDQPPATEVEAQRMARYAYAITAVHAAIPTDATVYYEVGTWTT